MSKPLFACLALLFVACGPSADGPVPEPRRTKSPPAPPSAAHPGTAEAPRLTADDLLRAQVESVCDEVDRCCRARYDGFERADCLAGYATNRWAACVRRAVSQGRVLLVESMAAECVAALSARAGCAASPWSRLVETKACGLALQGQLFEGEACDRTCGVDGWGSECEHGLFCNPAGLCERLPASAGSSCGTGGACPRGASCDEGTWTCAAQQPPGGSCTSDRACVPGYECVDDACAAFCR